MRSDRNRKGNVEMYDRKRYFTLTGHHVNGTLTTINDCGEAVPADAAREEAGEEGRRPAGQGGSQHVGHAEHRLACPSSHGRNPVFAPDGTLQTEPGYHPASRTFYAPTNGLSVRSVPEIPTREDVEYAVDPLAHELIGEFPFVGDAERAHAIALLLLPFARDLIDSATPFHLIEKPSPGTGATLLVDMLSYPAIGHAITAMTEGRDEDE